MPVLVVVVERSGVGVTWDGGEVVAGGATVPNSAHKGAWLDANPPQDHPLGIQGLVSPRVTYSQDSGDVK